MACNCATNEQIERLFQKYGEKKSVSKQETFEFKINNFLTKVGIGICCIILFPIIGLYVFYKAFGDDDHKISVNKFFKLKQKQLGSNVG